MKTLIRSDPVHIQIGHVTFSTFKIIDESGKNGTKIWLDNMGALFTFA